MFVIVLIPLAFLRAAGAVITAYKFGSVYFLIAYLPVFVMYLIVEEYCNKIWAYVHLLIAQSTTFFGLRLLRVERSLKEVTTTLIENDLQPHSMST